MLMSALVSGCTLTVRHELCVTPEGYTLHDGPRDHDNSATSMPRLWGGFKPLNQSKADWADSSMVRGVMTTS